MPTTVREFDPAHQSKQVERYRAMVETVKVAELDTPAGYFEVRRTGDGYELAGTGLRLFGGDPSFGTIPIVGADDADAVASVKSLILTRWREEAAHMEQTFFPPPPAPPAADPDRPDAPAELLEQEGF